MDYAAERDGAKLTVVGRSRRRGRDGNPLVTTKATFDGGRELSCVEVHVGARHRIARRVAPQAESKEAR
jgi:hypothetical protein